MAGCGSGLCSSCDPHPNALTPTLNLELDSDPCLKCPFAPPTPTEWPASHLYWQSHNPTHCVGVPPTWDPESHLGSREM